MHHYPGWRLKVVHQSVKELEQFLKTQEEELARFYHIPIPKQTDLPISYNIAPSQKVLTIRLNPETKVRSLDALQWVSIPLWASLMLNQQSDSGSRGDGGRMSASHAYTVQSIGHLRMPASRQ